MTSITLARPPVLCLMLLLGGCGTIGLFQPEDAARSSAEGTNEQTEEAAGTVLGSSPPPPSIARTEAALDTTTAQQRATAAAPTAAAQSSRSLGTTVATLGSPSEPGFWLKTPLVATQAQGRVANPATGKSSAVTLIPIDGQEGGGSRMSLAAMRLIGASLTDLAEVEVTLDG